MGNCRKRLLSNLIDALYPTPRIHELSLDILHNKGQGVDSTTKVSIVERRTERKAFNTGGNTFFADGYILATLQQQLLNRPHHC